MPDKLGADYWRMRAEEARTQADEMRTPAARKVLLDIAKNYDQLAVQADRVRLTAWRIKEG